MDSKQGVIFIEGGKYSDVKRALKKWIDLYSDALNTGLIFRLFQVDSLTVIELSQDIDNERFNYLVNYLTYPEDIDYQVVVNGYIEIDDKRMFPEQLLNEVVQIFIPENDTEFDLVYAVVQSGKTFRIDFGGKAEVVTSKRDFSIPKTSYQDYPSEIIGVDKKKVEQKKSKGKLQRFDRRFYIIATIYLLAIMIGGYFTFGSQNFITVVKIASFGLFFWTVMEHDFLRFDGIYIKLFGIALFLAIMGHFTAIEYPNNIWMKTTRMSLCFLILYQILRYSYKFLYKREPAFDKHSEFFADKVYSIILGFGSIIASMVI